MTNEELEALFDAHKGVGDELTPFEDHERKHLAQADSKPSGGHWMLLLLVGLVVVWLLWLLLTTQSRRTLERRRAEFLSLGSPEEIHRVNARSSIRRLRQKLADIAKERDCTERQLLIELGHELVGTAQAHARASGSNSIVDEVNDLSRKLAKASTKHTGLCVIRSEHEERGVIRMRAGGREKTRGRIFRARS